MIKLVPELPQDKIDLAKKLPLIDRYHAIMDGVDETIYELNQFRDKEYPIGIEFGLYGKVHSSLVSDYMSAVTDIVEGEPPLVVMTLKGGPELKRSPREFETITTPSRMHQYNNVIRWLLESHGAEVNLTVQLEKAPNPYAEFSSGTVRFISPFSDGHTMTISNPRYLDIFGFVNTFFNQFGDTDTAVLNEIISVGKVDGIPEYKFGMTDVSESIAITPSIQEEQ